VQNFVPQKERTAKEEREETQAQTPGPSTPPPIHALLSMFPNKVGYFFSDFHASGPEPMYLYISIYIQSLLLVFLKGRWQK